MFWSTKNFDQRSENELLKSMKQAFDRLHDDILRGHRNLSKRERNLLEKKILIDILSKLVRERLSDQKQKTIDKIISKLVKHLDTWWAEKEPDREFTMYK